MKTALVHDWLVTEGGSEKVLKALAELFPGPIYTLFQKDNSNEAIHTSFLQKIPGIQKYYRNFLPLFPFALKSFDLSSYDLIVSSSHCVAKSVAVLPHQTHICYCHTPMRYAWEAHLTPMHPIKKLLAKPVLKALQLYDQKTASRVDHFIANSTHVASRIRRFYGREATVIHPPVDTHLFSIAPEREDYFFTCARLVPYKRIDLLLETFAKLPKERLLIAGDGPQKEVLKRKAPNNVTFLGYLPDVRYRETLSKAKAFLHAAEEDFGIVLVEAQSAGIPVIAYGVGGSRDIVTPKKTGLFFEEQTPESL
ncbi:MAG: GDP-mannose-dependent alpha-(1-6)-phosphatidylinositol monomannoside mannosyltransferase, partial [Chlamydiae bacterium]|nr:GDP-mannose-dependent alpha-(1-6)-phosphatidylinositol monomannoside mannosyltransferase [Chlamydiota bacterium]